MFAPLLTTESLPKISSYGKYDSRGYGSRTLRVSTNGVDIFFSYETIVAFRADGCGLVVHQNDWSRTTGKHLTWIDGGGWRKKERVSDERFMQLWREFVSREAPQQVASGCLSDGSTTPRRAVLRKKEQEPRRVPDEEATAFD